MKTITARIPYRINDNYHYSFDDSIHIFQTIRIDDIHEFMTTVADVTEQVTNMLKFKWHKFDQAKLKKGKQYTVANWLEHEISGRIEYRQISIQVEIFDGEKFESQSIISQKYSNNSHYRFDAFLSETHSNFFIENKIEIIGDSYIINDSQSIAFSISEFIKYLELWQDRFNKAKKFVRADLLSEQSYLPASDVIVLGYVSMYYPHAYFTILTLGKINQTESVIETKDKGLHHAKYVIMQGGNFLEVAW